MLIGIDASSAAKPMRTGVEQYAFQLIEALKKLPLGTDQVRLYSPAKLSAPLDALPTGWESRVLSWPLAHAWMRARVGMEMLAHAPDVLFVPSQGLPFFSPRKKGKRTVTTIHDIGFLRVPALYDSHVVARTRAVTHRAVHLADHLITVSEFSKQELMNAYHIPVDRITVTPLAADTTFFHPLPASDVARVRDGYRLGPHYFLVVGRVEKKKNPLTAIEAFAIFKAHRGAGDPFELVFAGSPGFSFDEVKKYLEFHPQRERVHFLFHVDGDEIVALMNGATAVLCPSFYEGFGLTNLEALACGTPVIASDIPPHREVAGDAALFASPQAPEQWTEAMHRLADDTVLHSTLRARGLERATKFSWEKTAETTLAVLKSTS